MKSIKEAEQITGITTQNIRYYEKQKLLTPKRNHGNSYREYSDEDINRLKMIRLFRSLDMPIGDIRRMFDGDVSLEDTIRLQMRCRCAVWKAKEKNLPLPWISAARSRKHSLQIWMWTLILTK